MYFYKRLSIFIAFAIVLISGCSKEQENIKIGIMDPLSGPFANAGQHGLRELTLFVDRINDRGGVSYLQFEYPGV